MKFKPVTEECRIELLRQLRDPSISLKVKDCHRLRFMYGECSFPVPPVSTGNWDFIAWRKWYEGNGIEPIDGTKPIYIKDSAQGY